jgi:hypothetical protein
MSRKLLVLGSLISVGATASLLLFNQNSSRSPISIIPTLSNTSSTQSSFKKNENVLAPLLPSLRKPLTSTSELSLKESQPEPNISSQPIAKPTITSVKPKQFVSEPLAKSSLQTPPPIVTRELSNRELSNSVESRQFLSAEEAELSPKKLIPVFTHRSRPIVPPIDYQMVPTESLATPVPTAETPTPTQPFIAPTPTQPFITPTPTQPFITPTPTQPFITPTPTQPLTTATPITPIELLETPTPIQATPIISPSPTQPKPL